MSGNRTTQDLTTKVHLLYQEFDDCSDIHGGENATYIPQLANVDSDIFALSVCTVDGQRYTHGDNSTDKDHVYTLQSTSKPFNYAVALDLYGAEYVNKYIGKLCSNIKNFQTSQARNHQAQFSMKSV